MQTKLKLIRAFFICGLMIMLGAIFAQAQTSVFTTGLNNPAKIITAGSSSLLVAEAGTTAPNTGRISIVSRTTGERLTLIENLPSGVNNLGGSPAVSGPSGLKLLDTTLYLCIGVGDAVQSAGGSGLEMPNPNPASPIFDSVLSLVLPSDYETLSSGFTLSAANQTTLAAGGQVVLTNAQGKDLTVRLVVNLPDFRSEPRPGAPNNVRASNLYGIEAAAGLLYVVDAAFNLLYRVFIANGAFETFVTFPNYPNPTQTGPPFVDPVPDSVRLAGGNLYVSMLTGFPFAAGVAEIRSVNLATRNQTSFIPNLTSAIDVLPFNGAGGANDSYLALEFSANQLAQVPGRLKLFTSHTETPRILAGNLITPTSVARDAASGSIFVTELAPGRITRVNAPKAVYRDYFGTGKSNFLSSTVAGDNIVWNILRNPTGGSPAQIRRVTFGLTTDTVLYGDFDGDLKQDIAVYREGTTANPQSYFYIFPSTNPNTFISQPWGIIGDKPVTGDFDGDGRTDFCVTRRVGNQIVWFILPSAGGAFQAVTFGLASDRESLEGAADFNGDGRDDLIVTRTDPSGNLTHYAGDAASGAIISAVQWGNNSFATTTVLFGDYTGDNRADIAVNYGECNTNPTCETAGTWWILQTGSASHTVTRFGIPFNSQTGAGDRPVFGDWDGDGKLEISVFRTSNSTLYSLFSSNGQFFSQFWDGVSPGN